MIAFVTSNPTKKTKSKDVPLEGTRSHAIFRAWLRMLNIKETQVKILNVSNVVTPKNRPLLVKEFQLGKLKEGLQGCTQVIALGPTADKALSMLKKDHFTLPHPSPSNRELNDINYISERLLECYRYLNGRETKKSG